MLLVLRGGPALPRPRSHPSGKRAARAFREAEGTGPRGEQANREGSCERLADQSLQALGAAGWRA
eukprot:578943-Alexandrium_andersonii.AAC.1